MDKPRLVVTEMPTQRQVMDGTAREIVTWHLYLRPTRMQDELNIVKAIARRYDALSPSDRERIQTELRRLHG